MRRQPGAAGGGGVEEGGVVTLLFWEAVRPGSRRGVFWDRRLRLRVVADRGRVRRGRAPQGRACSGSEQQNTTGTTGRLQTGRLVHTPGKLF